MSLPRDSAFKAGQHGAISAARAVVGGVLYHHQPTVAGLVEMALFKAVARAVAQPAHRPFRGGLTHARRDQIERRGVSPDIVELALVAEHLRRLLVFVAVIGVQANVIAAGVRRQPVAELGQHFVERGQDLRSGGFTVSLVGHVLIIPGSWRLPSWPQLSSVRPSLARPFSEPPSFSSELSFCPSPDPWRRAR